jgi:cell division septation protein DedD
VRTLELAPPAAILMMIGLACLPISAAPLTFEQRWEPVAQIPAPRELTFEERWAPVRQLPQMIDLTAMPPPPPENRTAQVDSALFDKRPILSEEEAANIPNAPVRVIRVRVEQKPVPAFLFDPQPAAPALLQNAAVPPTPLPRPAIRPAATRRVASIRHQPGDICGRHGMHKEVTRGGKSWRCRR